MNHVDDSTLPNGKGDILNIGHNLGTSTCINSVEAFCEGQVFVDDNLLLTIPPIAETNNVSSTASHFETLPNFSITYLNERAILNNTTSRCYSASKNYNTYFSENILLDFDFQNSHADDIRNQIFVKSNYISSKKIRDSR